MALGNGREACPGGRGRGQFARRLHCDSWPVAMDNCRGMPEDAEAIAKAEAFLAQLREYRLRRWGKTQLEKALEGAVLRNPAEVIRNAMEREKTK